MDLDRVITHLKHFVRFTQQDITCVHGDSDMQ